ESRGGHPPGGCRGRGATAAARLRRLGGGPQLIASASGLLERAVSGHALRQHAGDVEVPRRPCRVVPRLDEEPRLVGVATLPSRDLDQRPAAAELLAAQDELELPLRQAS